MKEAPYSSVLVHFHISVVHACGDVAIEVSHSKTELDQIIGPIFKPHLQIFDSNPTTVPFLSKIALHCIQICCCFVEDPIKHPH